ncbi:hypothetical protein RUM44_010218 [Polyplax serrata]|uniref:Uncharacterized protein n=1 Tax=Polyplax serrata TaxID=468196 RepID=A0ABR1AUW5_POLSC
MKVTGPRCPRLQLEIKEGWFTQLEVEEFGFGEFGLRHLRPLYFLCLPRVIEKIDQSEFEGFEYVNPLLMSLEDCV